MARRKVTSPAIAAAACALLFVPAASAQTELSRPPEVRDRIVAQTFVTYALEIRDAALADPTRRDPIELRLSRVLAGAARVTGAIAGDPLTGYVDADAGEAVWIRYRNNQPWQAFVARRHAPSQGWSGTMYALAPGLAGGRAARNAYGFRAAPGPSFGANAPPLPPNPGVAADPLALSGSVERWFPLQSGNGASLGMLRVTIGANGAVSGQLGPAGATINPAYQVRGHYAANAGVLVFVRGAIPPSAQGAGRSEQVFVALLDNAQLMQGERYAVASGGFEQQWRVGAAHLLRSVQRSSECLTAENNATAAGAVLRTMRCARSDSHLSWSFIPPASDLLQAPSYRLVSLRSGLCAYRASGEPAFTQQGCAGSGGPRDMNINGLYLTRDGEVRITSRIRADQVTIYRALFFEFASESACPGVSTNDPTVRNNCADNNSYWMRWE